MKRLLSGILTSLLSVVAWAAPDTDVCAVRQTETTSKVGYNIPELRNLVSGSFPMTLNRITDLPGGLLPCNGAPNCDSTGPWGDNPTHHYTKDTPFSASIAPFLTIQNKAGSQNTKNTSLYLQACLPGRTGTTYYDIGRGNCPSYNIGDDRWLPGSGTVRVQVTTGTTPQYLRWTDITTCAVTRQWTIGATADYWNAIGAGEGQISEDGRYVALQHDADSTFLIVDMNSYPTLRTSATINAGTPCYLAVGCLPNPPDNTTGLDWVSMSPLHGFVVVSYKSSAGERVWTFADDGTTMTMTEKVYADHINGSCVPNCVTSPNGCSNGKNTYGDSAHGHIYALQHSDIAFNTLDADYGNSAEWIIGGEKCGLYGMAVNARWQGNTTKAGRLVQVRLNDGAVEVPLPYKCGTVQAVPARHTSAAGAHNAFNRNWLIVSWDNECILPYPQCEGFTETRRYSDEITAVKLIGTTSQSPAIRRVVKHHSTYLPNEVSGGCYRCEPHANGYGVSNSGLFESNWCYMSGSCTNPATSQEYSYSTPPVSGDPCP